MEKKLETAISLLGYIGDSGKEHGTYYNATIMELGLRVVSLGV